MAVENLKARAAMAAQAYVARIGMDLLDIDVMTDHGQIAIVAEDEGQLVHVAVFLNTEGLPAERTIKKYKARMRDWMAEHHMVRKVRYDSISLRVIADDRALLRHHRDIVGGEKP